MRVSLLAIGRGVVHRIKGVRVGLRGTLQVLRGRIADRDLDFLVLIMARAELVAAIGQRRGHVTGRRRRSCTYGGRSAVRAAVTVRGFIEVCAASAVNAQRQSLLLESISDSLGTCSIVDDKQF